MKLLLTTFVPLESFSDYVLFGKLSREEDVSGRGARTVLNIDLCEANIKFSDLTPEDESFLSGLDDDPYPCLPEARDTGFDFDGCTCPGGKFNDGCNDCTCDKEKGLTCTLKYCDTPEKAYCKK